jgi:hypothetical protein
MEKVKMGLCTLIEPRLPKTTKELVKLISKLEEEQLAKGFETIFISLSEYHGRGCLDFFVEGPPHIAKFIYTEVPMPGDDGYEA